MRNPEALQQSYEELAQRFARQGEHRPRDHCLILAADAALSAGHADQAERLRQRLLQYNPHHMLRPFLSMSAAMQMPDVQDYVADLRRQWPAELVADLLKKNGALPSETALDSSPVFGLEPPRGKAKDPFTAEPNSPRVRPPSHSSKTTSPTAQIPSVRPASPVAIFWSEVSATLLFFLGVVLVVGVLFFALIRPWFE